MANNNEYFTPSFTGQERGLAKVSQIEALANAIGTAFNLLPGLRALLEDRVTAVTATTSNGQAFTVTMTPAPTQYTDGMALNVRFPQVSEANPTLDVLDENNVSLGAKPIRDVNGAPLTAGHIAANVRAELYYVDHGQGYWILGAGGARGEPGPAGPPDGEFYIISGTTELGFRDGDGTPVHNFGQIAPRFRGAYASGTTYEFLDLVRSGSFLYLHVGLADTTGTAVTDTTVWQRWITEAAVAFSALTFAADLAWDVETHPNATLVLTGNLTGITLSNDEDGGVYVLRLAQDATGSRTWTPPASWLWPHGTAGILSTAANAVDKLILNKVGSDIEAILLNGLATA